MTMRRRRAQYRDNAWAPLAEFRSRRSDTVYTVRMNKTDFKVVCDCKIARYGGDVQCAHVKRLTANKVIDAAQKKLAADAQAEQDRAAVLAAARLARKARLAPAMEIIRGAAERANAPNNMVWFRYYSDGSLGRISLHSGNDEETWVRFTEELAPFLTNAAGRAVVRPLEADAELVDRGIRMIVLDEDDDA